MKKILFVDDTESMRRLYTKMFEPLGQVTTANDGFEALEILKNDSDFDIIVTDQMMPGMDGLELSSRIRDIPEYVRADIIIITAADRKIDTFEKNYMSGENAFFSKSDFEDIKLYIKRSLCQNNNP